jgi:outer membrane protein, heavy metal efflux system
MRGLIWLAIVGVFRAAEARELSLREAQALGSAQAAVVVLAKNQASVAQAEVDVAGTLANPTLGLNTATQTARFGTSLNVPLPVFGQRGKSIEAAERAAMAAQQNIDVVTVEARWAATLAWVDLWEAQEQTFVLKLSSLDAQRSLDIATQKQEVGQSARIDVLRTDADVSRTQAELAAAQELVLAASARVSQALALDPREALHATGALSLFDAVASTQQTKEAQATLNPRLKQAQSQSEAAGARIAAEQRLRWPTLNAQFAVNQFDPTTPGTDFIFGLAFDVPILNRRGGAISRALAEKAAFEARARSEVRDVTVERLDAFHRMQAARGRHLALQNRVLPEISEARSMTEDGYKLGRLDLLRLLEAQRTLLETRLAELSAHAALARTVADFERALGTSLLETKAP